MGSIIAAEQKAVDAFRAYLLRVLPAKVAEVNALRAPVLKSPIAGPFNVPAGAILQVKVAAGALVNKPLTAGGARTAAQVAADVGLGSSADTQGRFVLSGGAPTSATPGVVEVGADNAGAAGASTGANVALGFDSGGEKVVREALVAPGPKAVRDGRFGVLDVGAGMVLVFGDKTATNTRKNPRYYERDVSVRCSLYTPVPEGDLEAASEATESAVTCVRSSIFDDRTLDGAVQYSDVDSATTLGEVFRFNSNDGVSPLLTTANITLLARVFERSST